MASRTYENFDLLIEAVEAGGFRARVTSSPLGESPTANFTLPFDSTQLENLMLKLDPGRSGTRRAGSDPQTQASMELGGPLFESVFCEDIMLAWQRSQNFAREHGDGLRLRLRLTDAPAIAGLPWELLYDRRGNSFIAQSERTPVVRYLEVPQPPRPLAVDRALRILVVISSPTDLPELDVEAEWRRVKDALATRVRQGTVKIDRLPAPTIQALSAWLRQNDVDILHFIGHGDYDERIQDGVVYFQDRYGRSSKVSPTVLGPYLRDHDPLRLVLLNACQSARVDTTDPFSGMAQGLVQQDCTAVVAMQFPISDGAATTFTGEFYGALADGFPVDQAATSARKALIAEYAAEWATPVLFLRAPDGRVFDHIVAQPSMTAVPTEAPEVEPQDEIRAQKAYATQALRYLDIAQTGESAVLQGRGTRAEGRHHAQSEEGLEPEQSSRSISMPSEAQAPDHMTRNVVSRPMGRPAKEKSPVGLRFKALAVGLPLIGLLVALLLFWTGGTAGTRTVSVPSTAQWLDTGVVVNQGDILNLTATGSVAEPAPNPNQRFGPDGAQRDSVINGAVVDAGHKDPELSMPHSALIGKFGESGKPFFVGHSIRVDTRSDATKVGPLLLGVNDSLLKDNIGGFDVVVTVDQP